MLRMTNRNWEDELRSVAGFVLGKLGVFFGGTLGVVELAAAMMGGWGRSALLGRRLGEYLKVKLGQNIPKAL